MGREFDFPDECDAIVGRRMVIKLKKNEYNEKYPASSLSVIHFILCRDLTDNFNAASPGIV